MRSVFLIQRRGEVLICQMVRDVVENTLISPVGASDLCPLTLDFSSLAQVQLCSSADVCTGYASGLFFTQMCSVLQQVQAGASYEGLRTGTRHAFNKAKSYGITPKRHSYRRCRLHTNYSLCREELATGPMGFRTVTKITAPCLCE